MKVIKIQNYNDIGLLIINEDLIQYRTNKNEVLSGGPPTGSVSNILMKNNIFYGNIYTCISLHAGTQNDINIINNSFYSPYTAASLYGLTNSKIVNNILDSASQGFEGYEINGNVIDYNDIYNSIDPGFTQGPHSIISDPLFTDPDNGDLTLQVTPTPSPCIDAGAGNGTYSEVPLVDYNGTSRPIDWPTIPDVDDGTDIGAFEMPVFVPPTEFYANINNIYTGTHTGTELNPFTFNELNVHSNANPSAGYTYYIRGMRFEYDSNYLYVRGNIWKGWNLSTNGPWRINCPDELTVSGDIGGLIKDSILFINKKDELTMMPIYRYILNINVEANNCVFIRTDGYIIAEWNYKGCSFYGTIKDQDAPATITFVDCIIKEFFQVGSPGDIILTKCAIAQGDIGYTYNNCQLNWSMPLYPIWAEGRYAWDDEILLAGVTTPPQPGNPPYTGYETGLWDTPRTGIGAVDFDPPTPVVNNYYANIDNVYIGIHSGNSSDPFTFDELNIHSEANPSGNVYHIKGLRTRTGLTGLFCRNNEWKAWDIEINGPWRVAITTSGGENKDAIAILADIGSRGVSDAILAILTETIDNCICGGGQDGSPIGPFFTSYLEKCLIASNCVFITPPALEEGGTYSGIVLPHSHNANFIYGSYGQFKGCSIYSTVHEVEAASHYHTDCIIDSFENECGDLDNLLRNCAITQSFSTFFLNVCINCQFNWSMPPAPTWDAIRAAWNETILLAGITTPPLPGNLPYTNYEIGLWGTPRTGIGAVDFEEIITLTADFTASIWQGIAGLLVNFIDLSIGTIISWSWRFGDGGNSSDQNPSYAFFYYGIFPVTLTVSNGSLTDSITKYINIVSGPHIAYINATLLLEGDFTVNSDFIVSHRGIVIPVSDSDVSKTFYQYKINSYKTANGKGYVITSNTGNIIIEGTINGKGQGFKSNNGPGCNSLLKDSSGNELPGYGATHAGLGYIS